jgi:hypothetical protein
MVRDQFQIYNINRSLARAGIDPEKVDTSAHLDRTLSYSENRQNILRATGAAHSKSKKIALEKSKHKKTPRSWKEGEFYQIGKSNTKSDELQRAKPPGQRRSKTGKRYTERRKNRSDRPGSRV